MSTPYKIAMIGCGNLGSAMAKQWLASPIVQSILIVKPSPPSLSAPKIEYSADISAIHDRLDAVILAVKPQIIREVCESLAPHLSADTLIISIAAGTSIETLSSSFDKDQPIIRTMPNTPSAIGKGLISILKTEGTSDAHLSLTQDLLKPLGQTILINNEDDMHSSAAVNASGPAFLFYFTEALAAAAQEEGYSEKQAMQLARQTVIGAAALMDAQQDAPIKSLREAVTSKGGMTKAGLDILMDGRLDSVIQETIKAATERSKELGQK